MGRLTCLIVVTIIYINIIVPRVSCLEFNRNSFGVVFKPYVLNTTIIDYTIYSIEDIKTMLKVVSTKFIRVSTLETSVTDYYQENVTYYKTFSEVYTAEAAAILNQEVNLSNKNPTLSVYIGIYLRTDPDWMNTEMKLAFEAARKSNHIHSGTSVGLILYHFNIDDNITIANLAISKGKEIKDEAQSLKLKIGVKMFCESYERILNTPESMRDSLAEALVSILRQFDFIICIKTGDDYYKLGTFRAIELVTKGIAQLRDAIHLVNPDIEFMVELRASVGSTEKHFKFMLDFWTMVDYWGTNNNISFWMHEAFDNPWKMKLIGPSFAHVGWWKLKEDHPLTEVSSYEEKVLQLLVVPNLTTLTYSQPDTTTRPPNTSNDNETNVWVYIGSVFGPAFTVVALVLLVVQWNRINSFRRQILTRREIKLFKYGPLNDKNMDIENRNTEMQALNKPYDISIEIPKIRFQICWSSILGSGEFGVVYKANIKYSHDNNGVEVAVKMTKDNCPKTAVMSILSEIKILSHLGHNKNIVSIIGAYTAEIANGVVYLATELCDLGCLKNVLRKLPKIDNTQKGFSRQYQNIIASNLNVEFIQLVRWSYEIACGMEYLGENKVIHADLATRNVLLTADKTAKITDFGLSRRLYEYTEYVKKQQEPLPWRWMAIEVLKKLEFSTQSDVWSYGVTLWELFSMGDVPYPGLSWTLDFVESLETGSRMKCPRLASPDIYVMMSSCWEEEPQNRPTFTQLKQSFARMLEIQRNDSEGQEN